MERFAKNWRVAIRTSDWYKRNCREEGKMFYHFNEVYIYEE